MPNPRLVRYTAAVVVTAAVLTGTVGCGQSDSTGQVNRPSGPGAEAPPPLATRAAQASKVVNGEVVAVSDGKVDIRVIDVLKGPVRVGETVTVSAQTPPWVGSVTVGDRSVWMIGSGDPPQLIGGGPSGATEAEIRTVLTNP